MPTSGSPAAAAHAANSSTRVVVAQVLVPVGDHRAAAVPPLASDDVHLGGEEGVGRPHDRADVEVVLPVLDRDVEGMPSRVEVGDDRLEPPVAVAVDHVASVAVLEQLRVVVRLGRPGALPGSDADDEALGRLVASRGQPRARYVVAASSASRCRRSVQGRRLGPLPSTCARRPPERHAPQRTARSAGVDRPVRVVGAVGRRAHHLHRVLAVPDPAGRLAAVPGRPADLAERAGHRRRSGWPAWS